MSRAQPQEVYKPHECRTEGFWLSGGPAKPLEIPGYFLLEPMPSAYSSKEEYNSLRYFLRLLFSEINTGKLTGKCTYKCLYLKDI